MNALERARAQLRTNDRQWEAFGVTGHCVVLAPPGSGKTKLLSTRVAHDLATHVPMPHGAACITLTNASAQELKNRVHALGVQPRPTLFVGTVHGFALTGVIRPFAAAAGTPEIATASIATDAQRDEAFDLAVRHIYARGEDTRYLRETVDRHRKLMATPAVWRTAGAHIHALAQRYEQNLRCGQLIDFDDVVRIAVELVEENAFVRHVLLARYPRIYVDEYQDLAPGLDRLVRALCFGHSNTQGTNPHGTDAQLFAVGDPDQAIYGWTGSRPELLDELVAAPGVRSVRLAVNYRCGQEIIARSKRMLSGRRDIKGVRKGGRVTATLQSLGFAAQCQAAAQVVRQVRDAGTRLHEIAILCATRAECKQVADALRTSNMPVFVRQTEYEQTAATMLLEALAAWSLFGAESGGHRLGDLLKCWRTMLGPAWGKPSEIELVSVLLAWRTRAQDPAVSFLNDVLAAGMGEASTMSRAEDARALRGMNKALQSGALSAWSVSDLGDRARTTDRVEVTTMTSAKGLEFDVIIMLGLDEGHIPHASSVDKPEELAEEKRKFYVSLTRARHEVHMFYSGFTERRGRRSMRGPSRFLRQIGVVK
jgi:DNA helicase-2/ATP-dependent DNA helicase PcrA